MPRKYKGQGRQGKNWGQRFNIGVTTGVTLATIPSGVTIDQNGITNAGMVNTTGAITSGGSIQATGTVTGARFYNSGNSGQLPTYITANDTIMASGVTTCKGGTSQVFVGGAPPTGTAATGAYFGLTNFTTMARMFVTRDAGDGISGLTNALFAVSMGANAATVYYYDARGPVGTPLGKTTFHYFVIGT